MADPITEMRWASPTRLRLWHWRRLTLAPLMLLAACHPAKTVDYYRENAVDRDKMVNRCLSTSDNSWDCINAITAEAERWGTKDIDGFSVVISGDGPTSSTPAPSAPPN